MAKTKGHGNPKWTRDETILALDLYFASGDKIPSPKDQRVIELSNLLRRYPLHSAEARRSTFRNPDGVAFKLQNLRSVATGKGLGNTSELDRAVWKEFGDRPHDIKKISARIVDAINSDELIEEGTEDFEFEEGRLITRIHMAKERSSKLRKHVFETRRKSAGIYCDICSISAEIFPMGLKEAAFEIHHLLPISLSASRRTRVADTALLCANCHRLTHKLISIQGTWLSLPKLRELLRPVYAAPMESTPN